ncbi:SH3 domain-containing protein [Thioclava sp. FR2]|uniref:SH3 domain-containing protein n=1 Tax=Thioclava sp. FR2 TaxID=3445780 RepID=UPI003EC0AC75
MIRWTIVLCLGLFLTLQIAGEDRGQKRLGLIEGELDALADAQKAADLAAVEVASKASTSPSTPVTPVVEVAFANSATLVSPKPAVQPAIVPQAHAELIEASTAATDKEGTLMFVSGRSVNVRGGPSTRTPVVGKLSKGDAVLVVWAEDNGWARIRVEGDGIDGYMSLDFLTEADPAN